MAKLLITIVIRMMLMAMMTRSTNSLHMVVKLHFCLVLSNSKRNCC